MTKPAKRRGKILFINAIDEVRRDKTISMLEDKHIKKIFKAYRDYKDIDGFAKVVDNKTILENNATLSIPQYVSPLEMKADDANKQTFTELYSQWEQGRTELHKSVQALLMDVCKEQKTRQ